MIFVCFICFLSVLQTMETTATTQKQNRLDSTMPSCNINNYNSFYAGHNKKLENMIIEMKRKLDAIEQELKNLTKKVEPTKIGKLHGLLVSWISDLIYYWLSFGPPGYTIFFNALLCRRVIKDEYFSQRLYRLRIGQI